MTTSRAIFDHYFNTSDLKYSLSDISIIYYQGSEKSDPNHHLSPCNLKGDRMACITFNCSEDFTTRGRTSEHKLLLIYKSIDSYLDYLSAVHYSKTSVPIDKLIASKIATCLPPTMKDI